jgi:hypothetical protein
VTQAREHRGSLEDSMATAKPCTTRVELLAVASALVAARAPRIAAGTSVVRA